jgi:hypothetical protein
MQEGVARAFRRLFLPREAAQVTPRQEVDPGARARRVEPEALLAPGGEVEADGVGSYGAGPPQRTAQEARCYFVEE